MQNTSDSFELRSNIISSVVLWVKPHLNKGGDWSQDVPQSNKVISDFVTFLQLQTNVLKLDWRIRSQAHLQPCTLFQSVLYGRCTLHKMFAKNKHYVLRQPLFVPSFFFIHLLSYLYCVILTSVWWSILIHAINVTVIILLYAVCVCIMPGGVVYLYMYFVCVCACACVCV